MPEVGFTYIVARTPSSPLHVGATNDLLRSLHEHRNGKETDLAVESTVPTLLHFERFDEMEEALRRKEQLNDWPRDRKIELIREYNPHRQDLYVEACRIYGP